ncbi:NAD(P)-dependent oxidoreductase, partial [Candidatus Latescibacterota bacterium]
MKYRVAITDNAFSKEMSCFQNKLNEYDIACDLFEPYIDDPQRFREYDALAVQQFILDAPAVEKFRNGKCRLAVKFGVGYENLDLSALTDAGIYAANVPDYGPGTVSRHTLYCFLALAQHGAEYQQRMVQGRDLELGGSASAQANWTNKSRIPAIPLDRKTLGIIGYGRIGRKTAHHARPFFRNILACDPYIEHNEFDDFVQPTNLVSLLSTSDFITVHIPLFKTPQDVYSGYPEYTPKGITYDPTYHIIDKKALDTVKPGTFLVNTSRGGVVNEKDVMTALSTGRLAGVALDVFEREPLAGNDPIRSFAYADLPGNH